LPRSGIHIGAVLKERIKKIIKLTIGWFLLFLGVIGLFLPFLQGILFILGGLAILANEYPWAHRCLVWCKAKFKKKGPNSASRNPKSELSAAKPDSFKINEKPASPPPDTSPYAENKGTVSGLGSSERDKKRSHGF
jgi:hypothetical protein